MDRKSIRELDPVCNIFTLPNSYCSAKDFMISLMNPDPKKRPGPTEALTHKFFSNEQTASVSSNYSGSFQRGA